MTRRSRSELRHAFVEDVPEALDEGILYISIRHATAIHKCCCGCQNEVVTPLSPLDWQMTFDGDSISLSPSIGNWSFRCQSHYWIRHNHVEWDRRWSRKHIEEGRKQNRWLRHHGLEVPAVHTTPKQLESKPRLKNARGLWRELRRRLGDLL